jgi:CRP-like cAMP-binding protein
MSGFNEVQFTAGTYLFKAGEPADKLYILKEGFVSLLDAVSLKPFARLHQGESFGEQAVLAGGVRSATAVADGDVVCLEITALGLRQMLQKESSILTPVFEALLLQLYMHNALRQAE